MGEIFRFKMPLRTNLGGNYEIGDRVYKEPHSHIKEDFIYYPIEKGGYPLWENSEFKFVESHLEFVEQTDKPKEYYTQIVKAYTQEQLDEIENKKQTTV